MDIEKTMEFILSVQARLEASAQKHDEMLAKHDEILAKHDEQIGRLESSVATLTDLVGRLAQAQIRAVEQMTAGFAEVRGLYADTDSKLNTLLDTVDKLVRRNGDKE